MDAHERELAMKRALAFFALSLLALGCERPTLTSGAECTLNSECTAPLVCGLTRCRRQCVDSRDCGAGLRCLAIGEMGGACQLPTEAVCSLTSMCTPGLECRFGTCTTACALDRDCAAGATCERDPESDTTACIEPVAELCVYNSDCPAPLVCGRDQVCRLECVNQRDCPRNRDCIANLCELRDGG